MDLAQTMLSAAAPMLLQQSQHEQAVQHNTALMEKQLDEAARLHRQAISNAKQHHHEALDESARLSWEILEEEIAMNRELHSLQIKQQQTHFEQSRDLTIDHYEKAYEHVEALHKQQLGFALRTHTHQIQVAHESARRENVRDVWIQKGRKVDTMLITTTLMFAACVAVLCEGNLPHMSVEDFDGDAPSERMVIAWSIFAAVSFGSLLACIFLILATQARMAEYNIYEINQRYMCFRHGPTCACDHCSPALDHTEPNADGDTDNTRNRSGDSALSDSPSTASGTPLPWWRRTWESYGRIPQTHRTFEDYYACHCAGLANLASYFFNIGTVTLVVHAGMTLANRLSIIQDSDTAAIVYSTIFLVFVILIEVFHLSIHTKTRMSASDGDKNSRKNVDEFYDREKRIYEPLATVHTTKVPRAGKPVVMAKIETSGGGNPYLFLTFDDRTLTATDGDLDSECRISFREYDDVMKGTPAPSRWARNSTRSHSIATRYSEVPILRDRLYPDPYDNNQTKMFKVWYKIHDISQLKKDKLGDEISARLHEAEAKSKRSATKNEHRHEYKYYLDLSQPLLKLPKYPEEIALDEDERTRDEPWRFEEPRRGWAIVRIKYSETLLKKRTKQYQNMALKLARVDGHSGDGASMNLGSRLNPSGIARGEDHTLPRNSPTPIRNLSNFTVGGHRDSDVYSSDTADEDSDDGDDIFQPEINRRMARASLAPPSKVKQRRKTGWLGIERPLHLDSDVDSDRGQKTPESLSQRSERDQTSETHVEAPRIAQISV